MDCSENLTGNRLCLTTLARKEYNNGKQKPKYLKLLPFPPLVDLPPLSTKRVRAVTVLYMDGSKAPEVIGVDLEKDSKAELVLNKLEDSLDPPKQIGEQILAYYTSKSTINVDLGRKLEASTKLSDDWWGMYGVKVYRIPH